MKHPNPELKLFYNIEKHLTKEQILEMAKKMNLQLIEGSKGKIALDLALKVRQKSNVEEANRIFIDLVGG